MKYLNAYKKKSKRNEFMKKIKKIDNRKRQ